MENEIQEEIYVSEADSKITALQIVDSYSSNSAECDELLKDKASSTAIVAAKSAAVQTVCSLLVYCKVVTKVFQTSFRENTQDVSAALPEDILWIHFGICNRFLTSCYAIAFLQERIQKSVSIKGILIRNIFIFMFFCKLEVYVVFSCYWFLCFIARYCLLVLLFTVIINMLGLSKAEKKNNKILLLFLET